MSFANATSANAFSNQGFGQEHALVQRKILVIDENRSTCHFMRELFAFRFNILKVDEPNDAMTVVSKENPVVIILDVNLQRQNSFDLCQTLRNSPETRHIPILIYSASDDIEHITQAFERGADDFITKSARPREIVARVLAKVRRRDESTFQPSTIGCGNLTLNIDKLEACIDQRALALSVLEFNLLKYFVLNKDRVMSRAQILSGVWKDAIVSNRTIDTHMVYLRKKLTGFNHSLATVYGAGYILRSNPMQPAWPVQLESRT